MAQKILFVCLGNICRSPLAEGVFRDLLVEQKLAEQFDVDSAGTHAYHVGSAPDPRAVATAAQRGIDIAGLRGRQVSAADLDVFDHLLVMDRSNQEALLALSTSANQTRVHLLMEFAAGYGVDEVPDPYYGGPGGFERVLDMIQAAAEGLLQELRRATHR